MKDKIRINLQPINKTLEVNFGTPLIDVLNDFGVEFPCGGKGTCGNCKVKLLEGELKTSSQQQKKLKSLNLGENYRLACYCNAESDVTIEVSQFENIILADNSTFDFLPKGGFGVAVDLGTTTVVAQLINLKNGQLLDSVSAVNPQTRFGADLISRVQSCLDGNHTKMKNLIREQIGNMIQTMLTKNAVEVTQIIIVGNTVMHHIFSGFDVRPLSMYPFNTENLGARLFNSAELNWPFANGADICFSPSIGSFVGSDILAGIAATKMNEKSEYSVLIDLGTNGEIVVGNNQQIICASTAAGPAFEGAKIAQGMRATTGAISSVSTANNELFFHVIGNAKAKGICGSGLIDIISILLEQEKIGIFGEINSGEQEVKLTKSVSLTQQDIREFQLAKAALATGIQILLNKMGITMKDVDKVYIAGGFGHFLNIKNVIRTGLIEAGEEKIVKLGNTALIGSKMFLFEDGNFAKQILEKTSHVNLEGDPNFQDIYIEKMMLL